MLTERDVLNLSVLSLIKDGYKTSPTMRENIGLESSGRFTTLINDIPHRYVTKIKGKRTQSTIGNAPSEHSLTKVGRDFVSKHKDQVDYDGLANHCLNWVYKTHSKAKLPQPKTSGKAKSAIDGISELINANNKYLQFIKSINQQTAKILEESEEED